MKKTLIAAGIAAVVAAPVAFADVTVSGAVKYTLTNTDTATGGWTGGLDNEIHFKASEDLGNGLTAFAQISLDTDEMASGTYSTGQTKDQKLGIKGSFGTIVGGRMEGLTESVIMSKMDLGDHANGELSVNALNSARANAIAYVSPTMNGFHFAVAGLQNDTSTKKSLYGDRDVLVAYDNGPLSVFASKEMADGSNDDTTTMGASYAMGDLKGTILRADNSSTGDSMMYRVDYTMGNNVINVLFADAAKEDSTITDVTHIKLNHNFSKTMTAYVGYRDGDNESVTADSWYLGAIKKF
jgi:predicted porin